MHDLHTAVWVFLIMHPVLVMLSKTLITIYMVSAGTWTCTNITIRPFTFIYDIIYNTLQFPAGKAFITIIIP